MCRILLSINPEHVENIFKGKKEYEFRKTKCKRKVDGIIIYSTYPVMKVVGEAEVKAVIEDSPKEIWRKTAKKSGINKDFFDKYYKNKSFAVAYQLSNIVKFDSPKELKDYGIGYPPQSFIYIDETVLSQSS